MAFSKIRMICRFFPSKCFLIHNFHKIQRDGLFPALFQDGGGPLSSQLGVRVSSCLYRGSDSTLPHLSRLQHLLWEVQYLEQSHQTFAEYCR